MSSVAPKGGPKGASKNKNKSDSTATKYDKVDLNPKIQPTAEQMQIARIIDTHRSEDPNLAQKIKQVMEVTGTNEDEACMALHSREYDIEQAITLLTEGGAKSLESEWEQAGKKRKPKIATTKTDQASKDNVVLKDSGDKIVKEKADKRVDKSDKEFEQDDVFASGDQKKPERSYRGSRRGNRGFGRGNRNEASKDSEESGGRYGNRVSNGPGRGGGGRGRGRGGRTFANRTRGRDSNNTYNTMDVWENSQADTATDSKPMKVENWNQFPPAEDWDNEEYTGSLADTKVFTPSAQNQVMTPNENMNNIHNALGSGSESSKITGTNREQVSGVSSDVLSNVVTGMNGNGNTSGSVTNQPMNLTLLLNSKPQQVSGPVVTSNAGADILASLQSSYANANTIDSTNQGLPQRQKVQRPRGPATKIPSSAVEMPDKSVTALDVQFGGLELGSDSSVTFNSSIHSNKTSGADMLYGSPSAKLESFGPSEKDGISAISTSQTAFQSSRTPQSSLGESQKSSSGAVPISPSLENHSMPLQQNSNKSQSQTSFGSNSTAGSVSAFAFNAKGAAGFIAPVFPPVSQSTQIPSSYGATTGVVVGNGSFNPQPNNMQNPPSGSYSIGGLTFGAQSGVNSSQIPSQQQSSGMPSVSQSQVQNSSYGPTAPPANPYHHNSNSSTGFSNASSGSSQFSNYTPKIQASLSSVVGKESNEPVATSNASSSSSNISTGSGSSSTKLPSTSTNTTTSNAAKSSGNVGNTGIPPGMMMHPPYIPLGQGQAVPAFYSVQTPVYSYDENSVQFVPRLPPPLGYYADGTGNYGAVPGVSNRTDGSSLSAYSSGDGRFQRSDSSTASPVPSNLSGGNAQQPMYNPAVPGYYFVGNNMMHGHPFHYGPPPPLYPTTAMVTATNASGAPHAASANQYQTKTVYGSSYSYDGGQPNSEYNKNSYGSGSSVQSSNSTKGGSSNPTGSQNSELNSSMYGKGHNLGKLNSYEKQPFGNSAVAYGSLGAQTNPNQMGNPGMATPFNVYLSSPPVHTIPPIYQDGNNATRQGGGQPKGNKPYNPYWAS